MIDMNPAVTRTGFAENSLARRGYVDVGCGWSDPGLAVAGVAV
jgi:hypothetical protein